MKLASVPGSRGEGEGGGVWREVGIWGVCFQKLKLPLTWGQSLCPSESCSNLLTLALVGADVLMEIEILTTHINLRCAEAWIWADQDPWFVQVDKRVK